MGLFSSIMEKLGLAKRACAGVSDPHTPAL